MNNLQRLCPKKVKETKIDRKSYREKNECCRSLKIPLMRFKDKKKGRERFCHKICINGECIELN